MKKGIWTICALLLLVSGCSTGSDDTKKTSDETETPKDVELIQFEEPKANDYIATMETTMGSIKIHLFPSVAPKAVENFVTHANNGYYDNLSFHRVIADFMIQGGDPNGNGTGGESIWGSAFEDEFSDQLYNFNGALSMANAGPNTNGSQFFIVQNHDGSTLSDAYFEQIYQQMGTGFVHPDNVKKKYQELGGTPHLDHMHTVFGQVIEGMDVVNDIAAVEVDANDKPVKAVNILSISIEQVK